MEQKEKIKIFIIAVLFIIAIALFYFYTFLDNDTKSIENTNRSINQISKDKITKDIDSIITTFGIKKSWVKNILAKEKDPKNNTEQQLWISKEILIPVDLPTIDLNYEITNYLRSNNLVEEVTEDPRTKNILFNIITLQDSVQRRIGNLKFIYSDSVRRNASEVCIILDSLDSYNLNDVEKFLTSTQEFSVYLPLRNDKADFQSKIIDSKRDYLLKFSIGNEDNIEADFKDDVKESIWKSKVKLIALNFSQASGIILLDEKNLNDFYDKVRQEFLKNNIMSYDDTLIMQFKRSENKVASLFEDIISKSNKGRKFLVYAENFRPDEFANYDRQVYAMKKLGYKFLNFKEIIKRIDKLDR